MQKSSRIAAALALAVSVGGAILSPAAAAASDYKVATDADLRIPDASGHIIIQRDAKKIMGCTSDDHFILTYMFAQSKPQNIQRNSPAHTEAYLKRMHNTFMQASRYHSAAIFEVGNRSPLTLPPKFYQRLEAASHEFNKANGTSLNWMIRVFTTSDAPYQPCINYRLKNPLPANN